MGIPVVLGRDFNEHDRMGSKRVVVVNQSFIRKFCTNENPLGLLVVGDWATPEPAEIVGIVGDTRHDALTSEPRPTFFLSQAQSPGYITFLVVRTQSEPERLASAIRHQVLRVDPSQPVTDLKMMEQYIAAVLAKPRLYAVFVSSFSVLALVLAAIGLSGLMAYSVSRRTHEIGVRMALGAHPRAVLRSMMGHGTRLAALGLAIGIGASLLVNRFITTFLYEVTATDLQTYAGVVLVFVGVALAANYIPALRASRVDPIVALRYE
jgi:putative ABC transport system permease protein